MHVDSKRSHKFIHPRLTPFDIHTSRVCTFLYAVLATSPPHFKVGWLVGLLVMNSSVFGSKLGVDVHLHGPSGLELL